MSVVDRKERTVSTIDEAARPRLDVGWTAFRIFRTENLKCCAERRKCCAEFGIFCAENGKCRTDFGGLRVENAKCRTEFGIFGMEKAKCCEEFWIFCAERAKFRSDFPILSLAGSKVLRIRFNPCPISEIRRRNGYI